MPTPPALAYRQAAAQQASSVGLVIALLDTLAGDLQRAATAMASKDIEDRARNLKHGFAVLTQLDTLVDADHGGQTAQQLRRFYGYLRTEMLRAQFQQEHHILDRTRGYVLDVRGAWEAVAVRSAPGTAYAGMNSLAPASEQLDCSA